MTDEFTPGRRRQVEEYLYRKLDPSELVTVSSLGELTPAQQAVVRTLAPKHRLVCMIYLCGVVDGILTREALDFIDAVRGPHL